MNFIHLKTQTEFSINQGLNRIPNLVKQAKENNMGALAITDFNGLFGSINFYKECRAKGIKPIIGLDATIEQEDGNYYQLTFLAKNEQGYKQIIALNSRAYISNRKSEIAPIKEEWLGELKDVIVLSGAKKGLIGQKILSNQMDDALSIAKEMKDFFGNDFYIELQRDGSKEETNYMDGAIKICQKLDLPPVATHPVLFSSPDDFFAHETRYCIGHKESLFSMNREKPFNKEMYFKTSNEMSDLFSDLPEALENTVSIAKKCNIELHLDDPKLPNFPIPNNENPNDYFSEIARKGLEQRLIEDFEDEKEREKQRPIYEKRLEMEIDIIQKMGFPGYFLIVSDFITWAKEHDIPVGPGRGSGAGSLVAYAMKITDLDPIPYNLIFERFLNPDRVSMPDFDIDFCQARRNEVYEYVREKYGEDSVCQIGTFGTMAAKAVVRDVGRALSFNYDFVDTLAKMIFIPANKPITLKQFIFGDEEKDIQPDEKLLARYNNEPDVRKLIDIALRLEGITKQVGTHAAGVVIAPTTIIDFSPLYTLDIDSQPSTQFEMSDVEKSGLVKFDFLGLRNLTIIKEAVDLINKRRKNNFNLKKINLNDQDIYENIFANGNTIGIFQFEGKGMTAVLQKAQPKKLEDLIAINALYRPGPMEIIPEWLEAKRLPEDQRPYPHPKLRNILKETYGFMIYQEQVMQCAQIIAGYSLGGADLLRRAMGKKKPEEMKKQREIFVQGAEKNGVNEETATQLFDLIEKFSGYGFNKSHAAAYSYLAFQTAYLKNYFPEEFLTANLNSHIGTLDTDKISILVNDARKNKINILSPDINSSEYAFTVESNGNIRYGLGAIKGVGEKAALSIQRDRELNGPYTDFYNFLERVGKGNVNKRVLEALVKAGVFDNFNSNRAVLFESIAEGLDYITKFRKKQMDNISVLGDSLFDENVTITKKTKKKKETLELEKPVLKTADNWDELTSIKNEKSVLGYFFSSNPYKTYYTIQLDGFESSIPLSQLRQEYENGNTEAYIGGLIEEINWWKSKKGAFVKISDGTSTAEVRMYSDFLNENKEWLKQDSFISLKIKMQTDDSDNLNYSFLQGFNFDETQKLTMNKIFVGSDNNEENIAHFEKICEPYIVNSNVSDISISLYFPNEQGRKTKKVKSFNINPNPKLFECLQKQFGQEWVKMTFKKSIDNIRFPDLNKKQGNKNKYKRNSFVS